MKKHNRPVLLLKLFISILCLLSYCELAMGAAEDWMPDPVLKQLVKEKLGIPNHIPMLPQDMQHLYALVSDGDGIESLEGLQHAVNLEFLHIGSSHISDLTPLAGLIKLHTLKLYNNQISDLTPLTGLVNLEVLQLEDNQIEDFTPLLNLPKLQKVETHRNLVDITELMALNLTSRKICILPQDSVEIRLENINTPPTFAAWHNIINLPTLEWEERLTYHHLYFSVPSYFGLGWFLTPDGWKLLGDIERAQSIRTEMFSKNPNMIFLAVINYYYGHPDEYPEDWPYWLRDASGKRVSDGNWGVYWIDFTYPEIQDMVVQQAIEIAKCGLYDGIVLDHWNEGRRLEASRTLEEEYTARDKILQGIRKAVSDDFLILVNTNRSKIPRWASYVNGTFMETLRDYEGGYTHAGLREIEDTLLWSEQNFREPQINSLEGWGVESEPLDSRKNKQWMRVFTTLNLTHSDGYVQYVTGIHSPVHTHTYELYEGHSEEHTIGKHHDHQHQHNYYRFYDAPIGRPVGGDETKGVHYETPKGISIDGLFIREFTNGWVVYNRSGKERLIQLPEKVTGWHSGIKDKRWHTLGDLDGEIYVKSVANENPTPADVNADGVVNILDLVAVANAFGKQSPDLNGDGVVNILDLVQTSQALK